MDERNPTAGSGAEAEARTRHVLLVEDEQLVAMDMVGQLEQLGWTVVGPASTLEEAQVLVSSGIEFDAAVLDVNLQGRWVHALAEELRSRGVPFVVCTGYEMVDPDGRFEGAPLVAKPIVGSRLGDALASLLGGEEPSLEPAQPSID